MVENFIAIDVETANSSRGSICQIGVAAYRGSNRSWVWSTLVNPEEPFDEGNVRIHGISSCDVKAAPTYPSVLEALLENIQVGFVASHTRFDFDALHVAARKYGLRVPDTRWIDTCEVARFAWPNLERHRLDFLCHHLSVDLKHHDAGSDAVACAEILTQAVLHTRMGIEGLATQVGLVTSADERTARPSRRFSPKLSMVGADSGPLKGQVMVCTGEFAIGEDELVKLAARLGCDVEDRFSKKRTTILVVGTRDASKFHGKAKSNKLIAAEEAAAKGSRIAILSEEQFLELANRHRAA